MKLSAKTKIDDLLNRHPFLEEFLVKYNSRYEMLRSKVARATVGKVANLKSVSALGGIKLADLLRDLAAEVERVTGDRPETGDNGDGDRQQRIDGLKQVIRELHDGAEVAEVRERFAEAIAGADSSEIAEMEQQLISEGMAVEEVQRLCDVHVGAFREVLDGEAGVEASPGHPVHTYMSANERIAALANRLGELTRGLAGAADAKRKEAFEQLRQVVEELAGVDLHYTRKENQLFPFLEKHGISGPSKVMWGIHDEIRGVLKKVRGAVEAGDAMALVELGPKLARDVAEMIYKENKILFPMAMKTLSDDEWKEVRAGEDDLGYAFVKPGGGWPAGGGESRVAGVGTGDLLRLHTGELTAGMVDLMLTHLPLDLTFVDTNDEVRYYSEGERHFPRSPAVIGRKVQNCHPPASIGTVNRILDAFRAGEKDSADFWIEHGGKFLYIRYFAVRDTAGVYQGCLEVSQDVSEIRGLEGERRLLDWDRG